MTITPEEVARLAADGEPRCAKCGNRRSEHNYRHPFQSSHPKVLEAAAPDMAALIAELKAERDALVDALSEIKRLAREGQDNPLTAGRQLERIEELAAGVKEADVIRAAVAAALTEALWEAQHAADAEIAADRIRALIDAPAKLALQRAITNAVAEATKLTVPIAALRQMLAEARAEGMDEAAELAFGMIDSPWDVFVRNRVRARAAEVREKNDER